MKVDKDQLLKHHFWIVVGLSVPIALVAIMILSTSVRSATEDLRKKLDGKLKEVKSQKPTTPETVDKKKVEADYLVGYETDAWGKAFAEQEPLLRWPRRMEATYHFADGLFANEVHLIKVPEKDQWPADKPGELQHGMLVSADESKFEVVDKDGKKHYTFFATPRLSTKGGVVDDRPDAKTKDLFFADLARQDSKTTAVAVTFQKARYFNDRLTEGEQLEYKKTYLSQIPPILRIVDPVRMAKDDDGKPYLAGVVQLRTGNGTFDITDDRRDYDEYDNKNQVDPSVRSKLIPSGDAKFIRYVTVPWDATKDFSEEAWIAQEDLCIQKEIYRLVRAANDSLSSFTEVPGTRNDKQKTVTYKNAYLQVKMTLADANTLNLVVTNQLKQRQKIESLKVRAWFADPKKAKNAEPEMFKVVSETKDADPLEPMDVKGGGQERKVTVRLKQGPRRDGIFGLEQVLTWETAAVKRIDNMSIGGAEDISLSQKGMSVELQPYKPKPKVEAPADDKGGMQGGSGMPNGGKGMGVGMGGLGGAAGGAATALPHGLIPDRYLEVTPQFRRVPVAVVLIVDQNHVDRVLTAFNNSKLRFLMTQVLLNHYGRSVKPDLSSEHPDEGGAAGPGPMGPMGPMGPGGSGGPAFPGGSGKGGPMGPGRPGGFFGGGKMPGGFGPPGGGDTYGNQPAATDNMEANMELVIYGIVTLYERYPPKPAAGSGAEPAKTP